MTEMKQQIFGHLKGAPKQKFLLALRQRNCSNISICRVCTVNQHLCNRSTFFLGNSAPHGCDVGSFSTPIKSRKILTHDKDTSATPAGLVYDITDYHTQNGSAHNFVFVIAKHQFLTKYTTIQLENCSEFIFYSTSITKMMMLCLGSPLMPSCVPSGTCRG